jgi:hypothetical protein
MDWNRPIDLYCERLVPGLLAEPVTAASNLAFFVAAYVLFRHVRGHDRDFRVLATLIALIGAGSLAFHTFATYWAAVADRLAIALFIWFYLQRVLVRLAGLGPLTATAIVIGYAVASRLVESAFPPGALNGSVSYLPALAALLLITAWVGVARRRLLRPFVLASLVFLASLTLRSVDLAVCPTFSIGTHFLWHVLNAVVVFSLVVGLARGASGRLR